jgi:hypothetical protein
MRHWVFESGFYGLNLGACLNLEGANTSNIQGERGGAQSGGGEVARDVIRQLLVIAGSHALSRRV